MRRVYSLILSRAREKKTDHSLLRACGILFAMFHEQYKCEEKNTQK